MYRYVGQPGHHFYGVPARDLTAEDYGALDEGQQAAVVAGSLYEAVEVAGAARRRRSAPDAEPPAAPQDGD